MEEIIEFLTKFHSEAPPFIKQNQDGSYSLVGDSDLAKGEFIDYGELGEYRLTAMNHTRTLVSLMNFLTIADAMADNALDFSEVENKAFLEFEFENVLAAYFDKSVEFDYEVAWQFLEGNKTLVNEVLYNLTRDKDNEPEDSYQDIVDSLDGMQFKDPYVSIAYEIAKEFKLRPLDVMNEWSTSELIVLFAKTANDNSQQNFLNWKYNQPKAPKQKKPTKQRFYYEEVGTGEKDE